MVSRISSRWAGPGNQDMVGPLRSGTAMSDEASSKYLPCTNQSDKTLKKGSRLAQLALCR